MMANAIVLLLLAAGPNWVGGTVPELNRVWVKGVILQAELFLKDPSHPFNRKDNVATVEFIVDSDGRVRKIQMVGSNGVSEFDTTVLEACRDISSFPKPPSQLLSDDGMVHLFWTLARSKPYLRNGTVRFVRFPPERAIPLFLSRGHLRKAWGRALRQGRKALSVFVGEMVARWGSSLGPYRDLVRAGLDAYLSLGGDVDVAGALLLKDLEKYAPDALHAFVLERKAASLACRLLARNVSLPRRIAVERALLEMTGGAPPCPGEKYWRSRLEAKEFAQKYTAVAALYRLGHKDEMRPVLLDAFKSQTTRTLAIRAMGLTRDPTFEGKVLYAFLPKKGTVPMKREALVAFSLLGTKKGKSIIVAYIQKKNAGLRTLAMRLAISMEGLEKARGYAFLAQIRRDPVYKNKLLAAKGLAAVAFPNFVNEVRGLLRNKNPDAVVAAIEGLDASREEARKMILPFLTDKRAKVRRAAVLKLLPYADKPEVAAALSHLKETEGVAGLVRILMGPGSPELLEAKDGAEVVAGAAALARKGRLAVLEEACTKMTARRDGYARLILMALGAALK